MAKPRFKRILTNERADNWVLISSIIDSVRPFLPKRTVAFKLESLEAETTQSGILNSTPLYQMDAFFPYCNEDKL